MSAFAWHVAARRWQVRALLAEKRLERLSRIVFNTEEEDKGVPEHEEEEKRKKEEEEKKKQQPGQPGQGQPKPGDPQKPGGGGRY